MSALPASNVIPLGRVARLSTKVELSELADLAPVLPAKARIYLALRCHDLDGRGFACPPVSMLAREADCSPRYVWRALRELEADGFVEREHRYTAKGDPTSNGYRLKKPAGGSELAVQYPPELVVQHQEELIEKEPRSPEGGDLGSAQARATRADPPPDISNDGTKKGRPRRHRGRPNACHMTPVDDWVRTPADDSFALEQGHDDDWIERQNAKFCDYHRARRNRFADWSAAWRNWVRREQDYERDRAQRRGSETPEERARRRDIQQRSASYNGLLLYRARRAAAEASAA